MCATLFVLEWTISGSPDPDNPNEQPPGTEIYDHRLYGSKVKTITTQQQSYNRQQFGKANYSSTLTTAFTMEEEFVLTALCEKCGDVLDYLPS